LAKADLNKIFAVFTHLLGPVSDRVTSGTVRDRPERLKETGPSG
jgi:hypothetical protein